MSDISKALQGKNRNGHIKDLPEKQLDLFLSLSDRPSAPSPQTKTRPPATPGPKREDPPEVEMVLPPLGEPPDVSAEIRSVLSESRTVRPVVPVDPSASGRPALRTGIYRRPKRPMAPPPPIQPPKPPRSSSGNRFSPGQAIAGFFSGLEVDRRLVALVVLLVVLVALIATWTACPRQPAGETPGTLLDLTAVNAVPVESTVTEAVVIAAPVVKQPSPPTPAVPAENWKVKGTVATMQGSTLHVRFEDGVFISSEKISVKGMRALKAVAKKLLTMKAGAQVVVIGHTDNVSLSKPTLQFRSNKELAELRAKVALDHLAQFSRKNKALEFSPETGAPSEAPYPNDTAKNRRLNRTVTLQITPAP